MRNNSGNRKKYGPSPGRRERILARKGYRHGQTSRRAMLKDKVRNHFEFTDIDLTGMETCYKVVRGEMIRIEGG